MIDSLNEPVSIYQAHYSTTINKPLLCKNSNRVRGVQVLNFAVFLLLNWQGRQIQ